MLIKYNLKTKNTLKNPANAMFKIQQKKKKKRKESCLTSENIPLTVKHANVPH